VLLLAALGAKRHDPESGLLRRLLRAKDRMDSAYYEEWPIQRLVQVRAVSAAHFARSFKSAFGVPSHRYLLARRLERAVTLLCDTDFSVTQIAFETGWRSLGTFGCAFRDVIGENWCAIKKIDKVSAVIYSFGYIHQAPALLALRKAASIQMQWLDINRIDQGEKNVSKEW